MAGKLKLAVVVAALVALCVAMTADAAVPTRASYVNKAESICTAGSKQAGKKIVQAFKLKENGNIGAAHRSVGKATHALKAMFKRVKRLPRPPGDSAKIARFIRFETKAVKSLGHGLNLLVSDRSAKKAFNQTAAYGHKGNKAVAGFGFKKCGFED